MNEYKVMCEVSFPKFDKIIDVAIPVNKTVYYVCQMLDKIIFETMSVNYQPTKTEILVDKDNCKVYDKNELVKTSGIGNGTRLVYY